MLRYHKIDLVLTEAPALMTVESSLPAPEGWSVNLLSGTFFSDIRQLAHPLAVARLLIRDEFSDEALRSRYSVVLIREISCVLNSKCVRGRVDVQ